MLSQNFSSSLRGVLQLLRQALSSHQMDYTAMPVRRAIVLLAVPMILELCMESVFALVDIFFVNRWLGNHAVTAIGLTESVLSLVYAMAIGISMAATAMVARRTGEKDAEGAATAAAQALMLGLGVSVIIALAGSWFAADILRLMAAEPETIARGAGYTRIVLGGNIVIVGLFLINGIFRGAGNAIMAMKSLWLANIINILLCPLGIWWLGIEGAAWATTIGRGAGVVYQLYHLWGGNSFVQIQSKHLRPVKPVLRSLLNIASTGTLQFIIASGSWIVLARLVAETGHSAASAGYQTAIRVLLFFLLPAWGLSNAAATLVGQHLGAKQPAMAQKSVYETARINAWFMAMVTGLFVLGAPWLIGWFTQEPQARQFGIQALSIISAGYVFYGIGMVLANAFNGAGDTRTPTFINLFGFWMLQIPLAILLSKYGQLGPKGVFIAIPVAETVITLVAYYFFKRGAWKRVVV